MGANDEVDPKIRDKGNPLSGMSIFWVDETQSLIMIKRSLSPGPKLLLATKFCENRSPALQSTGRLPVYW